jgi:hypothetical protein
MLKGVYVADAFCLDELDVLSGVVIFGVRFRIEMQLFVLTEEFVIVIERKLVVQFLIEANTSLVSPAPRDVLDGVSATSEQKKW